MGRDKLIIKNTCRRTHFSWGERLILQNYYNGANTYKKIKSPTLLGKLFGKNERTIRRELHRGKVEHLNTHLETIIEYNAEYAQAAAEDNYSH